MSQHASTFEKQITKTVRLEYLLALPAGYGDDPARQWPLILFLHGAGERGNNVDLVKAHGIPYVVEHGTELPFIVVSPRCPHGTNWVGQFDALEALLGEIAAAHAVDQQHIYLTGLSMGGNGTWQFATLFPERFAAIAPVCGWGDFWAGFPTAVKALKNLPIWAFHGDMDEIVPLAGSQQLVDILQECGGDVRFTIYSGVGHNSWSATYDNPELYAWFLSHTRRPEGAH